MKVWHHLYLPDRGAAERIARQLRGAAYSTEGREAEPRWLVRAEHTIPSSADALEAVADSLTDLAVKENGEYDGWERETGSTSTTTVTDPLGNQTVYQYANNLALSVTQAANTPIAATTTYTYDPKLLAVTSVTHPASQTSLTTYDSKANPLTKTDPLGNTTTYTYNGFSEPLTVKDPLGTTTTDTYDSNGNLLTTSTPLAGSGSNRVTAYTYGDSSHPGDVTAMTDPTNHTWTYTYDTYGNRTSSTDALGEKTTSTYDSLSRLISTVSPLGNVTGGNPTAHTTTYSYNAMGQPLTVTDPMGHQVVNVYDADGHLTQTTDPDGNVTTYAFDLDGRPTSSTSGYGTPQATTSRTTYDADGNKLTQVDGLNHTLATYTYDALNREASSADGLGRTTTYAYDAAGRLVDTVNPLNQTTSYTYDADGRLTGTSYSDGVTPSVSMTYDADGQALTMVDGTGTTTNVWDSLNRLTQQTDGAGHVVGYGYDLAGRLTSITYPGGLGSVTRTYDAAGRLTGVQDWLSHQTTLSYDANSNLTGITYPNGVVATWTYNDADQVASISDVNGQTSILSLAYTLDSNDQVTGENSTSYAYNSLNQLAGGSGQTYTYDAAGRLTQAVSTSATTNYSYDTADEMTSASVVGGATTTYGYDADGRRTGAGATPLSWNQQDRLLSYGSSDTYTYNGSGLRVSKSVGGQAEAFVWDTAEGLPLLLQDGATSYVTGPGGAPLEQVSGSTVYYYQQDQLGSTRALTDSSGAVAATYTYDPYGNLASQTGSVSNPFLFSGQYRDAESGMYYLRARYYDPATGQFISRDPKTATTGTPYVYVADNPLNLTDASGLDIGGAIGSWVDNNIVQPMESLTGSSSSASISSFSTNLGHFAQGLVCGFTFSLSFSGGTWFQAGEAVGVAAAVGILLTGPEDPVADDLALVDASRTAEEIPTVTFSASRAPGIAENIRAAQAEGLPAVLNRETDQALIDANRAAACRGFCGPDSPDEYPFASTMQGGAGARVTGVPLIEQKIQGGILSRFYQEFGIDQGDPFRVEVGD